MKASEMRTRSENRTPAKRDPETGGILGTLERAAARGSFTYGPVFDVGPMFAGLRELGYTLVPRDDAGFDVTW